MLEVGDVDGWGQFGVLDETDEGLLCHRCGQRYTHLGLHAWRGHGITADTYREAHGLARSRGLVATPTREVIADNARERLSAKDAFLAARSPAEASSIPRNISPQGREAVRATNRASRGRGRIGTVVECEQCGSLFCPLAGARRRRFCTRSCASIYGRAARKQLIEQSDIAGERGRATSESDQRGGLPVA